MKKSLILVLLPAVLVGCTHNQQKQTVNSMQTQSTTMEKNQIYVTALIYLHEGQQNKFENYRARAAAILEQHGARLEKVIKPTMLAEGNMQLPDEIHFAVFADQASMDAVNSDPGYQRIIKEWRDPAVANLIVIPARLSDFEFVREVGDKSKVYGIAFLNYNAGNRYEKMFEDYHDQVCEIMPEFGTHFERFLIPTGIKGDFRQPDEIHRFYFDNMDGLQQMGSDPRMLKLFPLRDRSLSQLNFIIGEAI